MVILFCIILGVILALLGRPSRLSGTPPRSRLCQGNVNADDFYYHLIILAIFVLIGAMAWLFLGAWGSSPIVRAKDSSPLKQPIQLESEKITEPITQNPNANKMPQSFSGWQRWSDGYTWKLAPEESKRELCGRLALATRKGVSANYFYDAFNAFYNTDERRILSTSLDDATRLMEAGSSVLPENMKKY